MQTVTLLTHCMCAVLNSMPLILACFAIDGGPRHVIIIVIIIGGLSPMWEVALYLQQEQSKTKAE